MLAVIIIVTIIATATVVVDVYHWSTPLGSTAPCCYQAAIADGKPYVWAIDPVVDGTNASLFSRLLSIVDGCVTPNPIDRLTVPHLLDLLAAVQHDASLGAVGGCVSPVATAAFTPLSAAGRGTVYDVLAIVEALERLAIDAAAVVDAVGGQTAASLDAVRAAGVPFAKCLALKKTLHAAVYGPAQVPPMEPCARARLLLLG